ncbi:hypothetical protein [Sulfurimonas autotrophica]|uniref:Motility protein n=1 Tax=Sulfurimonas autotrophica (strain ATCC BAA-671 / DSM 16294 / JCM 11897 / OK10) TaxID=563040 RepID=E0USM4_SULAO|nr:hypothetical protein [Sulfurimonas autotrophica]ADN09187.1 hypothetical protein Saut_1139 [Sulfurimonas autotrophica DSM 16294]
MEVSSSTQSSSGGVGQVDILKKAQDVQAQQVLKVLEDAQEQSQEITAQKTGVGKNINITG